MTELLSTQCNEKASLDEYAKVGIEMSFSKIEWVGI